MYVFNTCTDVATCHGAILQRWRFHYDSHIANISVDWWENLRETTDGKPTPNHSGFLQVFLMMMKPVFVVVESKFCLWLKIGVVKDTFGCG